VAKREDLKKLNELSELRSKKLGEMRELLSISSDTDDGSVLGIMNWWRKTASTEDSIPTELKTKMDRLFCEFRSLENLYLEILDRLRRGEARP
jgi:hypothetical protein